MTNILILVVIFLLLSQLHQTRRMEMALSARAQAIIDRINTLNTNLQTDIAAEEAAHDAANTAAEDADDDAIEDAVSTLESSVGATPTTPAPLPPAGS